MQEKKKRKRKGESVKVENNQCIQVVNMASATLIFLGTAQPHCYSTEVKSKKMLSWYTIMSHHSA